MFLSHGIDSMELILYLPKGILLKKELHLSNVPLDVFFLFFPPFYLGERQRLGVGVESEHSHPQVPAPNACSGQGTKVGSQKQHMAARNPTTGAVTTASQGLH